MKLFLSLLVFILLAQPTIQAEADLATTLQEKAARQLDEGNPDDALKTLKKLTKKRPEYAGGHANYGFLLFTKAKTQLHEGGNPKKSLELFWEAEAHLKKAVELMSDEEKELKAQSLFLLGDVNSHIFKNKSTAKTYYTSALQLNPAHEGAKSELELLENSNPEQGKV